MTQLERLKLRLTENTSDEELEDLLESAKAVILSRRFPFGEVPDEIERRYKDLQIRIAVEMHSKIGAEGQTSHSENGISRTFASASVSEDLLREMTPKGGVI